MNTATASPPYLPPHQPPQFYGQHIIADSAGRLAVTKLCIQGDQYGTD